MGRTNSTYRNHLENFIQMFKPFRKALRKENKEYLDSLWEKAYKHSSAASYMNASNPGLPIMISIIMAQQKEIEQNHERIRKLEEKFSDVQS